MYLDQEKVLSTLKILNNMNKITLNKNEVQLIFQTINIPISAYGYEEFFLSTKIDEKYIIEFIAHIRNRKDDLIIEDKKLIKILIIALYKAYEISEDEYHTLTGYTDAEFYKLVEKLLKYTDIK